MPSPRTRLHRRPGRLTSATSTSSSTTPADPTRPATSTTPDGYVASVTQNMFGPMRLTMKCYDPAQVQQRSRRGQRRQHRLHVGIPLRGIRSGLRRLKDGPDRPDHEPRAALGPTTGIRVNAVAPGLIDTRMTTPAMGIPEIMDVEIGFHTPLGRPGTPEDCAGAVLFLCTDAASYITGTSVAVDGGYLTV